MAELPPRQNPLDRPDGYSAIASAKPKKQQQQAAPTNFIGKVATSGPGKILLGGLAKLEPLSVPRNIVQSTLKEVSDLASGKGFSKEDWNKQRKHGTGPIFQTGNKWVDRLGGLAVDIGTDPLMYLHLGKVHSISALERAASGARFVAAGGSVATGAKIAQRGSYFLTDAERALAGYSKAGVYFMGARIAGTAKVGRAGEQTFAGLRMLMGRGKLGEMAKAAFSPEQVKAARTALRLGKFPNDEAAAHALAVLNSPAKGRAVEKINVDLTRQEFGGIRNQQGEALKNFDNTVHRVLENPELVVSPQEQGLANVIRNQLKSMHERLVATGQELYATFKLGEIKNYFPHVPTRDGFKEIRTNTELTKILKITDNDWKTPGSFLPRQLKEGETFFKRELTAEDLTVERLNKIARDGGFKGDFFETSVTKVLETYAANYSKQMGKFAQFDYLKKTGAVDYITSAFAPSNAAIKIGKDRFSAAATTVKERENAVSAVNAQIAELRARNIDTDIANTVSEIGSIDARAAGDALVLKKINEARAAIAKENEQFAGLFDIDGSPKDAELLQLYDVRAQLGQKLQAVQDDLDQMAELIGNSMNESHVATVELGARENFLKTLEDLNAGLEIKAAELNSFIDTATAGKELFDAHLISILNGESLPAKLKVSEELKQAVQEIKSGQKTVGAQTKALSKKEVSKLNAARKKNNMLSIWWKGIPKEFPLSQRRVTNMTTVDMQARMAIAAQGHSTLIDLQTTTAALLHRIDMSYTMTSAEGVATKLAMPKEIQSLYDQLVVEMEKTYKIKRNLNRHLNARQRTNLTNKTTRKQSVIAAMERGIDGPLELEDSVTYFTKEIEKIDIQLDNFNRSGGVKNRKQQLLSSKDTNEEFYNDLLRRKKDHLDKIDKIETQRFHFGSGSAQEVFSIRGGKTLPSSKSTKHLLAKTKGNNPRPVGSLEDLKASLEENIVRLAYKEEGTVGATNAKLKEMGLYVQVTKEQARKQSEIIERLFVVSETFRRATQVQDVLLERGIVMDEKAFNHIFSRIVEQRHAVWNGRRTTIDAANEQFGSLEAAFDAAVEAGTDEGWKAFAKVRKTLLESSDTDLTKVVGRGTSVNTQNEGETLLRGFEDARSVRQQASQQNRPTESYRRLAGVEAGEKVAPTNARAFEETASDYDVIMSGPGGDQMVMTSTKELRIRRDQAEKDLIEWYNNVAGKLPGQTVGETGKFSPVKLEKKQLDEIKKLLSKGSYYTELPTQRTAQNLINILRDSLNSEKTLASRLSKFFTDALDTQASARGVMRGEAQDTPLSHSWFMQSYAEKMDALLMGKEGPPKITANNAKLEPKKADYSDTVDGYIAYKNDLNDWITNPETSTSRDLGALELKERVRSADSRTVDAENRTEQLRIELEASRGEKRTPKGLDAKVIKERQAANRALREFESNPEYDLAVAASKKKEALAKYADYSLEDVNQVLQESGFPGMGAFTPEEWDSMFIGQVSIRKIKIVKDELAVLDEEIKALRIKKAGYKQAARQSQIEEEIAVKLNFRTERARMYESMRKIYSDETIKSSAADKFAKTKEILKETELMATPVLSPRRIVKPNSSKVQTEQRLQSLEFNWSQSPEKKLLDEHSILFNKEPATNTRGLAERYESSRKEILEIATQKEKDIANIATKTEKAQSLFQDVTKRIDDSAVAGTGGVPKAGASIPSTPEDLQDAALGLSRAANRINTIEDQRLASKVTKNTLSEEVKLARQELRAAKKSLDNNPQAIAAAKARVVEATGRADLAKKQGERLLKGARMLDDIKNGKLEKISVNGKDLRGSLEKNLESVEKKIRLKTEAMAKPVDVAQKRLDEAVATYGPNFADSYYAQYDQFANKPILEEKLLVLKEMKTGLGPRNAETKAQVDKLIKDIEKLITTTGKTDSSNATEMLLRSLETQRIGAEYHLAFSRGNLFREEATLKAIKDGVGGDMVGVLKEGWRRLGYPSDEEKATLEQLTKKQRKDLGVMGPEKTESNVADLGFPGLQAPQDVVDSFQSVLRNFSTKQGTNDVFDFLGGYTRFFKAYATLSPGFHVRNAMSNGFAMLSADANIKNLKDGLVLWKRYRDNPKTWLEGLSPKQARDAQAALEASFSTGSGRTRDMLAGVGQGKLTDNRALQFSQAVGERVEGSSRFMLSYDGIIKGMDSGQAGARVTKYLFDYSNPSMIDEKLRNIVPFWIWMSRNLPLQLVNRWTNPRAYVAYENFVKSVSQDSSNDAVPQYMREAGAFKIANGLFLQPDLGFNRVQQTVTEAGDPTRLLSYVNPALRLIPELSGNRRYYNNQPFSDKPQELKGASALLAPFLQMAGMTTTGANGSQYASDRTKYAIGNLLPTFAQGERLFPSTEGGNQKRASSWATWMGLPIKELTPNMEKSEKFRREKLDSDIRARRKNLGY